MVVLFSGEQGKVRAWARGARKPRSRLGALEVGNELDVGWFEREGRELVNVDRADLVESALPLVRDPVRGAALTFFADLADLFASEGVASPQLYRLMAACRDALLGGSPPEAVAAYFEAWALRLSGFYPRPARCGCGAAFAESGARFYAGGPSWRCPECPGGPSEPSASLAGPALALLDEIWRAPPSGVAPKRRDALELFAFHGLLTDAVVERRLPTRDALASVLGAA